MQTFDFIIIDDNEIDIFIARKMILNKLPDAVTHTFLKAADAFQFVKNSLPSKNKTIILVDINMPVMDGFQFMELFEKLPLEIQNHYIPCFLTSSVNEGDIEIANTFKTAKHYLNKPLSQNTLENLFNNF